jgi:hypothetical protein
LRERNERLADTVPGGHQQVLAIAMGNDVGSEAARRSPSPTGRRCSNFGQLVFEGDAAGVAADPRIQEAYLGAA